MKLIFAGTPEFARIALAKLHAAGHEIVLVLTQPDRPAGRGMKLHPSPVKQFALDHALALAQPRSLKLDGKYPEDAKAARALLDAAQADAMVVAAYGLILPQWALDVPVHGCFNIHASLLPRWRGAAPIHRAIEAGDLDTGVTLMQMDAGLDTGDMLLIEKCAVASEDTTAILHNKLAALGADLVVRALADTAAGKLKPVRQPLDGVTYAHKIEKFEAEIDWAQPADLIVRRVRAFNPFPGASTQLGGETLKVWSAGVGASLPPPTANFGSILAIADDSIDVVAINSVVSITELQRPGGKRLKVADFLRGFDLRVGMAFEKRAS